MNAGKFKSLSEAMGGGAANDEGEEEDAFLTAARDVHAAAQGDDPDAFAVALKRAIRECGGMGEGPSKKGGAALLIAPKE